MIVYVKEDIMEHLVNYVCIIKYAKRAYIIFKNLIFLVLSRAT